jgi:mRNA interferase RelE/StbE
VRPYQLHIESDALGALKRLPADLQATIRARIRALAADPRPPGATALTGELKGSYRLRARRAYRIGYDVDDETRTVTVWQVGHRSKFYDKAGRRRR